MNTNSEDFQLRYSWKSLFIMLVLFSVLFAYIVFLGIDDIISSILDADIIFLLLALFVYYLSLIVRSFRWRLFLDSLTNQYKKVSYWDIYTLITFSFALNNVFPLRTGELYRPYELSKKFNYSLLSSFATVVLERTFDVIIMGSLIITSAMFQGMDTLLSTTEIAGNLIFSLVIILGFVLLLFFLSREETTYIIVLILNYLSGLIQKKIIPEEEETAQKVSIEVSHLLKNKKVVIIGILSSLIIWLME
ncbi:MAG: flippase-like domain-containing protein, partial [Candidatus Heimdallarchaeota archaeon]